MIICNLESLPHFSCPNSDPKHSILFGPKPCLPCSHFPRVVEPAVYLPSDFCTNVILWFLSFSHMSGCFASVLNSCQAFVSSHSWGLGLGYGAGVGGGKHSKYFLGVALTYDCPVSRGHGPSKWTWRVTERSEGISFFLTQEEPGQLFRGLFFFFL